MIGPCRLVALGFAVALAALSWTLRNPPPFGDPAHPITELPMQLGGWSAEERPLSERQYQLLETREVVLRDWTHEGGGPRVTACVSVAGGNRKAAHPPHVCYRGQGWAILRREERAEELAGDEVRFEELLISQEGHQQLVWSWYRIGDEETASYLRQQWLGLLADLRGEAAPSVLMRFSTPVEALGEEAARHRLRRFLAESLPALEGALAARREGEPRDAAPPEFP